MTRNVRILNRHFVPAETLIIEQGALGNRAYLIESGGIEVFVKDVHGNEIVLSELGPGSLVGEMAALSSGYRSASARARKDSILVGISADDLHASMRASHSLYKRVMRLVVDRIRDTNLKLLEKEQRLMALEKVSRQNIENVASHLYAKQDRLQKEIMPYFDR